MADIIFRIFFTVAALALATFGAIKLAKSIKKRRG
jgi:hypothetical protein